MKIKVINANTTEEMTDKCRAAARNVASAGTIIEAVSPAMGPVAIEGNYDAALCVPGLLQEVRRGEAEGCDGYVIACFGDHGLAAARESARGPVVGMAEAAMHAASIISTGFSIITMFQRHRLHRENNVIAYGMTRKCRGVRATDLAVLDLEIKGFEARRIVTEECRRAVKEDHADCIILGCARMAEFAAEVAAKIRVPVIEGVTAAVKLVECLFGLGLGTSKAGGYGYPLQKPYRGALGTFAFEKIPA